MTKHWKTTGTRDGKPISIYVTTTDEVVAEDIACGQVHSLTLIGRRHNGRQNPTPDSDHFDLAAGAFIGAARTGIALRSGSSNAWSISEVEAIPDGLDAHTLGGSGREFRITVFGQSDA